MVLRKRNIKKRFARRGIYTDICRKFRITMKFFNTIPGDGEVAILLYGDVGDGQKVDSSRVVAELMDLQSRYKKIDVRINSNGGDVFSGIAIYEALRTCKADVTIYVDGVAASIAGIIAMCGKPLYMSPYARLMIHSVSGGGYGNATELRELAALMENLESDLAKMIAGRCGMKPEDITARYFDGSDHWLTAQEAVDMRLADGIYSMPDSNAPEGQTNEEVYKFFYNKLNTNQTKIKDMALIDKLRMLPSFKDANDEQGVIDLVRSLENKATKVDALERANNAYKERIEQAESKEIDAILNKAVSEGKISKEQLPSFKTLMDKDRKTTEALLNSMKLTATRRAVDYIYDKTGGGDSLAGMSWDEIDKAGRLKELKDTNIELFKNKYKERFGVDYKD
jgi:ATP-dependent Clp endopeptidase proteolytic subunit ClpP